MLLFDFIKCLLMIINLSLGAGISTHLAISSRILNINNNNELHREYLLSGSFFPDCFYNCLELSNISELIHWPPFLYELVKYYHKNNTKVEPDEFKSFCYGVLSHQIADNSWHSIRLNQGLLKYMANVEFNNNMNVAHQFIDSGGDFILLHKLFQNNDSDGEERLKDFFKTNWVYPIDDIVEIFANLGYGNVINKDNLQYCMMSGYSALQIELSSSLNSISSPVNYYLAESPIFQELYDDYYLGGTQEIMNTINKCVSNLKNWFDNIDEIKDPWTICDSFIKPRAELKEPQVYNNSLKIEHIEDSIHISPFVPMSYFGSSITTGKFLSDKDGECIAIGSPFEENSGSVYVIPIKELLMSKDFGSVVKLSSPLFLENTENSDSNQLQSFPSRYGYKSLRFMEKFLIVSSPGLSKLDFYFKNKLLLTLINKKSSIFYGAKGLKQIGVNLFSKENGDVIVSSKYSDNYDEGGNRGKQRGFVSVLNGKLLLEKLLQNLQTRNGAVAQEMSDFETEGSDFHLPTSLSQFTEYENFGSVIASSSSKTFIGVGSLGIVVVFENSWPIAIIKKDSIYYGIDKFVNDNIRQNWGSNFVKLNSKNSGSFANGNIATLNILNEDFLVVGAHTETIQGCINCGVGYLYKFEGIRIKLVSKIFLKSTFSNSNSNFFYNFKVQGDKLYVSALGYHKVGAIFSINLNQVINNYYQEYQFNLPDYILDYQINDALDLKILGPSNVGFTGFGREFELVTIDNSEEDDTETQQMVIVGMQYFGYGELYDDSMKLVGKVGLYWV